MVKGLKFLKNLRCERGHRTLTDDDKIDEKLFCTMVEGLLMRSEKEDKDKARFYSS